MLDGIKSRIVQSFSRSVVQSFSRSVVQSFSRSVVQSFSRSVVFRNNLGFSIVSVLIAAGMLGGLSLFLAEMAKRQVVTERKGATGVELNALHQRIISVLYDGDACLKTFGEGSSLHNGRVLTELKNKQGTTVIKSGQDIGRLLQVEKMEIQGVGAGRTKEAKLEVSIKKLGGANKGMKTVKKFDLTVEMDASETQIARCHHTLDSKEHGIHENICNALGGEMKSVGGAPTTKCTLTGVYKQFCEKLGGVYTDPPEGAPVGDCRNQPFFSKVSNYSLDSRDGIRLTHTTVESYKLCVLSYIRGPGGFNTKCLVSPNGHQSPTTWRLTLEDLDINGLWPGETHTCSMTCFN